MSRMASKAVIKRKLLILTLVAVIIFVLVAPGCVSVPGGGAFFQASVINDGSGGAIVVYEIRENGDNRNAYIQRIDAEGNKLWGERGKLLGVSIHSPLIASDGFGNAIAAWWQQGDIVAQKIDPEGHMLWQEGVPIFTNIKGFYWKKIVSDGFGGAIFCLSSGGAGKNLYVQKVNSEGQLLWIKDGKSVCLEAGVEDMPFSFDIASDNSGGSVVVWKKRASGIFVQRIDSEGNALWKQGGLEVSTPRSYNPRVIGDGSGGAITVWEHFEENEEGQQISSIYAQRVDAEGNILWRQGGLPVYSSLELPISNPQIVSDGSGDAIITWYTHNDIYAQKIDFDGNIQWSKDGVKVQGSEGLQAPHCVIADGSGGAIIAFERRSGSIRESAGLCYVQELDATGRSQWQPDGTLVSTKRCHPIISDDGSGGAVIICWPYVQRINAQGERMWGEKGILLSRGDILGCFWPFAQKIFCL